MEIKIEVDPEKEPDLYERVRKASKILTEEIIRPRAAQFVRTIEWSLVENFGPVASKKAVRLTVIDCYSGSKEEIFQPVELKSTDQMKSRLRQVWGDFLEQLSDEQMDRLDASIAALGKD
jgi:hypothetical protein